MASDMNRVCIVGRLTAEPVLRYTQGGTAVCSFSIANNKSYISNGEKKEQVSYFNCTCWAKGGEAIAEWVKKGHRIGLEGRLQQRSWEDKDGKKQYTVEIIVDQFYFLQPKSGESGGGSSGEPAHSGPPPESVLDGKAVTDAPSVDIGNPFSDEDIPF